MTTIMRDEINQQPECLLNSYKTNEKVFTAIAKAYKEKNIRTIVMAARGSSDNACQYFKYLCEIKLGAVVAFAAPSVLTLYEGKLDLTGTMVVGVSQSGKAADCNAILSRARENGALTVSITNNLESPMATNSDFHLYLNTGDEKSVAATKTFTAQLLCLSMLVAEISGNVQLKNNILGVSKAVSEVIKTENEIIDASKFFTRANDCYVLARGYNYCSCQEAALKIQETTYIKAKAYAISDFHHGPFAVIDHNASVLLFAQKGESSKDNIEMINKLKASGAFVLVMGNDDDALKLADACVKLPTVDETVVPFVYVTASQLFAHSLAMFRGINPDSPRGLKKVTITK